MICPEQDNLLVLLLLIRLIRGWTIFHHKTHEEMGYCPIPGSARHHFEPLQGYMLSGKSAIIIPHPMGMVTIQEA